MNSVWKYVKTIVDGEIYEIQGLNIWDFDWQDTGERVTVKHPLYNQEHVLTVFEFSYNGSAIKFAAGEFSNCVWGIYLPN